MKLIVGLGNPGKSYINNRHNIGFQIVDLLAAKHGLRFDVTQSRAKVALGPLSLAVPAATPEAGRREPAPQLARVGLVKPQTFMNVCGPSIAGVVRFYKILPSDMLVVYDDMDLPLGVLRLRSEGGSGGHNGVKSIMAALGTGQFPRLRIGIDRPPGRMDAAAYVLQDFSLEQEEVMLSSREQAVAACEDWLALGIVATMNTVNPRHARSAGEQPAVVEPAVDNGS